MFARWSPSPVKERLLCRCRAGEDDWRKPRAQAKAAAHPRACSSDGWPVAEPAHLLWFPDLQMAPLSVTLAVTFLVISWPRWSLCSYGLSLSLFSPHLEGISFPSWKETPLSLNSIFSRTFCRCSKSHYSARDQALENKDGKTSFSSYFFPKNKIASDHPALTIGQCLRGLALPFLIIVFLTPGAVFQFLNPEVPSLSEPLARCSFLSLRCPCS